MTEQTFRLPDLGEGLTEAEVVRWLVRVGDVVAVDQPVVEVETAKSVVEVPSPYAGRVIELHSSEGVPVDVGKPLITIASLVADQQGAPAAAAEQYREEERAGSGNVLIGYGTPGTETTPRRRRRTRDAIPSAGTASSPAPSEATPAPRVASPLVRQMARRAGLSLEAVTGTGRDGLITRGDVQLALDAAAAPVPPGVPTAPSELSARTQLPVTRRTPMTGFRKAVSQALTRSRSEIPDATVWVDVDFTELFALREATKATGKPVPGLLAYLARFSVAALRVYPQLCGEVDTAREELVQYDGVNLGLAVQTDRGLLVPSVMSADRMTTTELDAEIRRVLGAARDGKATPTELARGTFTLNNYGAFNVDGSAAIINHPQVAILGFGRVIDRAWVVGGELAVRKIGQMSFVFDHRVCDGGTASGFMRLVADAIEQPAAAIANL